MVIKKRIFSFKNSVWTHLPDSSCTDKLTRVFRIFLSISSFPNQETNSRRVIMSFFRAPSASSFAIKSLMASASGRSLNIQWVSLSSLQTLLNLYNLPSDRHRFDSDSTFRCRLWIFYAAPIRIQSQSLLRWIYCECFQLLFHNPAIYARVLRCCKRTIARICLLRSPLP